MTKDDRTALEDRMRAQGVPQEVDILFDGPPGPEGGRFVEVEFAGTRRSVNAGEWTHRDDGYHVLRVRMVVPPVPPRLPRSDYTYFDVPKGS